MEPSHNLEKGKEKTTEKKKQTPYFYFYVYPAVFSTLPAASRVNLRRCNEMYVPSVQSLASSVKVKTITCVAQRPNGQ